MVIFSKNKKNTEKKKHGKIVCTKMKLEKDVCGGVYAKKKMLARENFSYPSSIQKNDDSSLR